MSNHVNEMKFLFCCGAGNIARKCLCTRSLKIGTQIISVIQIILHIINIIFGFTLSPYGLGWFSLIYFLWNLVHLTAPILFILATIKSSFRLAYIGNLIYTFGTISFLTLSLLLGIIIGLFFIPVAEVTDEHTSDQILDFATLFLIIFFIWWGITFPLTLYFNYIYFSYTKQLGLENNTNINRSTMKTSKSSYAPPDYEN